MHVGDREDEAPDLRPRGFTPRRPPSFLSSLPSLLPEGLLNWHRFRTAPDSKSLPKCFHSATPVAALCSLGADRLRAKLFHEAAVAWDVGFAFRGTQGFPLFFKRESQRPIIVKQSGDVKRVSQMDPLSKNIVIVPMRDRKGLCLRGPFRGPEQMRVSHHAGGFTVTPSSCFVLEVWRISHSTFLV